MPTDPVTARSVCSDCSAAANAVRQQEAAAAKERQDAQKARRVENALEWLEQEQETEIASGFPSVTAALSLLAITEIMTKTSSKAVGPFGKLDYTLTGATDGDVDVLRELHQERWLVPTPPTTLDAVAFNDDDSVRAVYIKLIPWTLPRWMGSEEGRNKYAKTAMEVHLERNPEDIRKALIDVETNMVIDYLNGLLGRKYREDPIPEHRLPDAHTTVKDALAAGFTLEQLVAVAWSATAGSVAWGQRTPGLKPGSVAAATVTNLSRRIGYASDRPVPEYELPNWVPRPAVHAVALRMQARCDTLAKAMSTFFDLQHRVNSRQAHEMEADFAPHQFPRQQENFKGLVEDLRSAPHAKAENPISYAVLSPSGVLTFEHGTPSEMRNSVTGPGSGFVDRIMIEGTPTVNAYVGELVPATSENRNTIGVEMMALLGEPQDVVLGSIAFFAVTPTSKTPRGLDAEQQALLRAAHDAVTAPLHS
ncbi:MAG TPA: hypothetical protein VN520_21075 [Streptomyces sp.]|nr:hypothetical protein [Streptomyces sp.]